MFKFLRLAYMGYDSGTGTENSFTFIKSAEVAHGQCDEGEPGGCPKGEPGGAQAELDEEADVLQPDQDPGALSVGTFDTSSSVPSQTERLRDVYGVAQIPYSSHLGHGH